jgi:hypothetical protein
MASDGEISFSDDSEVEHSARFQINRLFVLDDCCQAPAPEDGEGAEGTFRVNRMYWSKVVAAVRNYMSLKTLPFHTRGTGFSVGVNVLSQPKVLRALFGAVSRFANVRVWTRNFSFDSKPHTLHRTAPSVTLFPQAVLLTKGMCHALDLISIVKVSVCSFVPSWHYAQ